MLTSNIHDKQLINLMSMSWTWSQEAKYGLSGSERSFIPYMCDETFSNQAWSTNSMFGGIPGERKFAIDVALIHKFTQPQQYHQAGLGKDGVVMVCDGSSRM